MRFSQISLRCFRNIEKQNLKVHPGLNVLKGPNGQGKTNFLEAIYLATHGRSFRAARWEDFVSKKDLEPQGFSIQATVEQKGFSHQLELKYQKKGKPPKKPETQ